MSTNTAHQSNYNKNSEVMQSDNSVKLCRTCGKNDFMFCNVAHEVVQKLLGFVPNLIAVDDESLPPNVCINCYQMIKTLVYNIEGIADMQKILKIQNKNIQQEVHKVQDAVEEKPLEINKKRSLVDDITRKYTNIKLRKISPEKTPTKADDIVTTLPKSQPKTDLKSKKITIVEEFKARPLPQALPLNRPESHRGFMCISCSEKFQKFSQLEVHLKSCKSSSTQQFKCFCGKVLSSKAELSEHVNMQHKDNKKQHICLVCKKVFTTLSTLQTHSMTHGNLKGIYMCHECNEKFIDLQGLKVHRADCKKKKSSES